MNTYPGYILGSGLLIQAIIGQVGIADETDDWKIPTSRPVILKRHTLKEIRDRYVVKQELDYSCGAAALATLMINYFGERTSERDILDLLNIRLKNLTEEEISRKKRVGFSLLDLKYVAQKKGYQAAGFRLSLQQLTQIVSPVIVFVRPLGYHHFAVLRGISGDRVFLADPSRGNLSMSTAHFSDEYGGVVFVLGKAGEESIDRYPLALGRSDDYDRPGISGLVESVNDFRTFTVNLAVRARPR